MITLFLESIEAVYTFKRRELIISNEKYKIESYLGSFDYNKFKQEFKKKKGTNFIKKLAKSVIKFSFKQGNLTSLQELIEDKLLSHRTYPDDKEEMNAIIAFVSKTLE